MVDHTWTANPCDWLPCRHTALPLVGCPQSIVYLHLPVVEGLIFCISATSHLGTSFPLFHARTGAALAIGIVVLPRPRFYQQGRGVGHDPGVPQLSQLLVVRLAVVTKLGGEDRSQLDKEDLYLYPTWVGCAAAVELQTKVIRRKDFTITEKASTRLLC